MCNDRHFFPFENPTDFYDMITDPIYPNVCMFRRRPSHFSLWFGEINIIYYYYDIKNVMFSANIEIHFNLYISNSILDFLHDLFLSLNMMNKYFRDLGDELDSEILYSSHIANSDNHLSYLGTSLKTLKILPRSTVVE